MTRRRKRSTRMKVMNRMRMGIRIIKDKRRWIREI
jgi:hypothetical protein